MDLEIRQRIQALQEKTFRAMRRAKAVRDAVPPADDSLGTVMPEKSAARIGRLRIEVDFLGRELRTRLVAMERQDDAIREAIDATMEADRIAIEYWNNRRDD